MKHFINYMKRYTKAKVICAPESPLQAMRVFALIFLFGLYLPCNSRASEAPLDTLDVSSLAKPAPDPRYDGADIPISRKLLPKAQATTLPKISTPHQPPRLDDPHAALWSEYLARKAGQQGNTEAKIINQNAASKAEPTNPHYLWPVIASAFKAMDFPTLMEKFPQAAALQIQNPIHSGSFVITAQQGIMLFLGVFWSVLVLALTLTWWRHLAHDLSAMLLRGKDHRANLWLPVLLPLVFLIIRPGWFGFLALMSVPLLIQSRGNSRKLLAGTWIATILISFPMWPILQNAVPAIDPSSEVNLLVKATTLNSSPIIRADLKKHLKEAESPAQEMRLTIALAIQEARRGHFKTSNTLFRKALATDSRNLPAKVGLANNMYYLGRLDTAADLFFEASMDHPENGLILHNQAQVFFKKLFIPEAADALDKSRDLGYHPPVWQNQNQSSKKYSPVVYPGLSNASLREVCSWESKNYPAGITIMNWNAVLGITPIPLFLLLSVPLLLAGALIMLWSHQHDPRECENCGVAVCGECCTVRQDSWLCNECGGIVDRARSDMILATLLKNRSRSLGMAASSLLTNQGRLFPGAGHLAIGKTFAAWIRLSLVSWGTFLILVAWAFVPSGKWQNPGLLLPGETINPVWAPLPTALWEGWITPMTLVGGGLIIGAWLLAIFDGTQLRHQQPERFSLSLSSTRPKQETPESHSVSVS